MALVLTRSAGADGAVLIAGRGHLRHGSGVPWALRQLDPSAETLTLAFLEVETGLRDDQGHVVWPRELRGDLASYDLVLPSDPVDRGDPCDRVIPRPVDEPISERGAGERSAGTEPPS